MYLRKRGNGKKLRAGVWLVSYSCAAKWGHVGCGVQPAQTSVRRRRSTDYCQ